jgi:hypothetical protein
MQTQGRAGSAPEAGVAERQRERAVAGSRDTRGQHGTLYLTPMLESRANLTTKKLRHQ